MLPLILLFATALASGPPVTIDDPAQCIEENGYLAGSLFGLDCCHFVVCDNARLNKTGFQGACMGGTAWNDGLKVCDDPKYVPDCNPQDCDVPSRTSAPCADAQPTGSTCCVGQNPDQGVNGYEPVFTAGNSPSGYFVGDDVDINLESFCPFGQVFVLEDCCCEYEYVLDPACEDTSSFFFENPDDPCCSFLQCWANRTGYDVVNCMGGSVYNAENQTCDTIYNVMDCMDTVCDNDFTDPPCDEGAGLGECCRAGTWFNSVAEDETQYEIVAGQGKGPSNIDGVNRLSCCPVDMNGEQMVFNATPGICCCEVPQEI